MSQEAANNQYLANRVPHVLSDKELWEMVGDIDTIHDDMDWFIGCMHMATILQAKRYSPEEALAGGLRFDPTLMRNMGRYLCGSGEVDWQHWPQTSNTPAQTPSSTA